MPCAFRHKGGMEFAHSLIEPVPETSDVSLATSDTWYLDSGESRHMTHHREWFEEILFHFLRLLLTNTCWWSFKITNAGLKI